MHYAGPTEFSVKGVRLSWNLALLLLASTSLLAGLILLDATPLSSVLIILGAMGFLMSPAASLCNGTKRPTNMHGKWQSNYNYGGLFASTTRRI
jgi:hypothetical protein